MTALVWYCRRCRSACRVQPSSALATACTCESPVPGLHPTEVALPDQTKPRTLHALSDEEARIRALARKGTRVRITFEATVADAIQWAAGERRGLEFDLRTADGRHFTVDPQLPGLHIEAAHADEESAS
ncbi:hypothetical protein OHR86_27885 [Streptomyces sp. NBC_00441]|uniref:hypothetical protein n=1 Tax=Streptomyces sp. NBC_00441 TaxID=2975742 RepID=UPI002E2B55E6|nr:hypothetical protein [Streptomyces sp. NBC_00441]